MFADGPRRPLSAVERDRWQAHAEAERHAGRLTRSDLAVGAVLLRHLDADGRCEPYHATLAAEAGCTTRTVRRALRRMKAAGLLAWRQRAVRKPWPGAGPKATRAERAGNAYELLPPATDEASISPQTAALPEHP